MTEPAGLAAAFVAGIAVATALGGGMAAARAKTQTAVVQGQQVTVHRVMTPTVTDQDIALLRQDIRAMKLKALRLKYVPVMNQILPGKKAATFFQLERKLCLMVDLQLFSQIPLAHEKESVSR
jgi:hypothetical protein